MAIPYEFKNREELIRALQKERATLSKKFDYRINDLSTLIKESIAGNTFRAFQRMPHRPSVFFRDWAFARFSKQETIASLKSISSQREYDEWLYDTARNLFDSWKERMGKERRIAYGPRMKLCNLLLKRLVLWEKIPESRRKVLISFLHVPLDQYTLMAIRNCIESDIERDMIGEIPKRATMNFVKNTTMYIGLQNIIREISTRAGVPAIFLDLLAWDKQHRNMANDTVSREQFSDPNYSETHGGERKKKRFVWKYDHETRVLFITNEDGKRHEYSLREIANILRELKKRFQENSFPLANNVEKLANGSERMGLGKIILEKRTGEIYHAQGSSYLGVVLEQCGYFKWNGKHKGIEWRIIFSDFGENVLSNRLSKFKK